ncbi:hypothetical protein M409DRAFT_27132 [Zasmidium cellare ATCC 36951]|uniref:BTB domain-containing protein n=1 Tax=Zasmidium cellare ATCC 36951 TaxID=1080233 RepID=A0A6A6C8C8_ZASCE|nr:uncharacterized protein M409DRAFT_27132 [Zasmidium cellare ATCC 36951]KAF2162508.1 hypothetical protein M409DRAFT_27132 [Zasmidium cellare ATCC 36951]
MADTAVAFAEQLKLSKATNITIYVGRRQPDIEPYVLPKIVLSNAAPYFHKIVNCDFKEGQEGVLHFPEDDQYSWRLFIYWLFNRRLPEPDRPAPPNPRHLGPRALSPFFSALIKAWSLGDKYDIPAFQNSVTLRMIRTFEISFPAMENVTEVFETTPVGCPLRQLIVEELVTATMKLRVAKIADIAPLSKLDGFFPLFIQCYQDLCANVQRYPLHNYGRNSTEMQKYLVEEDRDLANEVEAMMREHGQA